MQEIIQNINQVLGAFVPLMTLIIAGCAVWISVRNGRETRKHNKLSVRPILGFHDNRKNIKDGKRFIQFVLQNNGVGPAVIKNFILRHDSEEVTRNDSDAYNAFIDEKLKKLHLVTRGSHTPDSAMLPSAEVILLSFECKNEEEAEAIAEADRLGLRIEYTSIYKDETFILDTLD